MLPEQGEFLRKAGCLDLSKLKSELLASPSIPEEFKKESENLLTEYRRFLALKTIFHDTSPPLALSPSAIIDQVWHLHLLTPVHYTKCCKLLGEELIDHDPSASRDCIELRQKRLDMTKRSYKVAFGEDPPQKFWAINYEFSAARVGSISPCYQETERDKKDKASDKEKDERKDLKANRDDKVVDEPSSCDWDKSCKMTLLKGSTINKDNKNPVILVQSETVDEIYKTDCEICNYFKGDIAQIPGHLCQIDLKLPELPTGWTEKMSRTSGCPYYVNSVTKEKQWQWPAHPAVDHSIPESL